MTRGEKAKEYFKEGYNCSQAVCLAFSEELGLPEEVISKAVSAFGGGMGRMREVCGAVSGIVYVLSSTDGYSSPTANAEKAELYKKTQALLNKFKEENGSIVCRELLSGVKTSEGAAPEARTAEYYKKRPCAELVESAADILDEYLKSK
jgi:C_GCAxxG_C_C family probable redox protein